MEDKSSSPCKNVPGASVHIIIISLFLIQTLDKSRSDCLSFHDIANLLSSLLKGDSIDKMSLLYQCHIPPAWQEKDVEDLAENDEKG